VAKKASRRLVIDASVARSATFHDNPTSSACRKFLQEVLKVCHKVLLTREIETEWEYAALHVVSKADQMRIRFLVAWMIEMQSKAKILRPQVPRDESLRTKINHLGLPENHRQDLSEDLHLVEAALATDRVVISRDERRPHSAPWHQWQLSGNPEGSLVQPRYARGRSLGMAKNRSSRR
jgi:hypothetical protein